jgi:hypothetical protein
MTACRPQETAGGGVFGTESRFVFVSIITSSETCADGARETSSPPGTIVLDPFILSPQGIGPSPHEATGGYSRTVRGLIVQDRCLLIGSVVIFSNHSRQVWLSSGRKAVKIRSETSGRHKGKDRELSMLQPGNIGGQDA